MLTHCCIVWIIRYLLFSSNVVFAFVTKLRKEHSTFDNVGRALRSKNAVASLKTTWSPQLSTTASFVQKIDGLLDEVSFEEQCIFDETLEKLRNQLPMILTTPLTSEEAESLYDSTVKLVGPKQTSKSQNTEVLSSGLDELVAISSTLVAATRAAETAQKALAGFQPSSSKEKEEENTNNKAGNNQVECQLIILVNEELSSNTNQTVSKTTNNNNTLPLKKIDTSRVWVRWKARPTSIALSTPRPSTSKSSQKNNNNMNMVEGLSEFQLSPDNGKVILHRLIDITVNGRTIIAVGETLANLRRAARSIPSDLFKDSPFRNVFEDVRDALQQQAAAQAAAIAASTSIDDLTSILVTTNSTWMSNPSLLEMEQDNQTLTNRTRLVDDDNNDNVNNDPDIHMTKNISQIPLPGSKLWQEYKSFHQILYNFWNDGIPILAGLSEQDSTSSSSIPEMIIDDIFNDNNDNDKDIDIAESLFTSDAILIGVDGKTEILQGGSKIAKVYRTMSSFRRASNGKWKIQKAYTDWKTRTFTIDWIATANTPSRNGGGDNAVVVPSKVEGTDRFILNSKGQVIRMEQIHLSVGGNQILDPEPIRTILVAIERGGLSAPVEAMNDFWKRFGTSSASSSTDGDLSSTKSSSSIRKEKRKTSKGTNNGATSGPPELQDDAAASVYNLMRCLHRDLVALSKVPGESFLTDEVKLRGYMGEQIIKGKTTYKQIIGVALSTLRGLQQTKRIFKESPPKTTIEFTSKGNLKVKLVLPLRVNPVAGVTPNTAASISNDEDENGDWDGDGDGDVSFLPPFRSGLPFKIELISEYRLNADGMVKDHRLIETRINGQLTPDEVILRWIRNLVSSSGDERKKNKRDEGNPILDLISVARSFGLSGGGNNRL